MIREEQHIKKYPYSGGFYSFEIDDTKPLDQRLPEEILVENVEHCDIQSITARHNAAFLGAGYTVYFPLTPNPEWDGLNESERYLPINVRRGMTFKGGYPLYPVEGEVELVRFSQLGQAAVYIKVTTESEL